MVRQLVLVQQIGVRFPVLQLGYLGDNQKQVPSMVKGNPFAPIAQLVEQFPCKEWVTGSNPVGGFQ